TKRDNFSRLSPDEKTRPLRHGLRDATKKFLRQRFEFHWRALVHLEIERINRVNVRRDIGHNFHINLSRALCLSELSTQALAADVTERQRDRKSTRLNSSHSQISYAVFCLKKK